MSKRNPETKWLDQDQLAAETMAYYGLNVELPLEIVVDERALLNLQTLQAEVEKHFPRGLAETIDLSFLESSE